MSDATQRAEHAHRILTDELVVEAFETLERDLIALWVGSAEKDVDVRERAYRMLFSMRAFKTCFERILIEGQLHQNRLQQLKRESR